MHCRKLGKQYSHKDSCRKGALKAPFLHELSSLNTRPDHRKNSWVVTYKAYSITVQISKKADALVSLLATQNHITESTGCE